MKYPVVRLDNVQGTHDGTKLRSAQFAAQEEPVVNGTIVELGALKESEREIFVATMANKTAPLYLVATPEMVYDKPGMGDFVNPGNGILRCYRLCSGDVFSVSAEYFPSAAPTKGGAVGVTSGKIVNGAGTVALGKCIDIETAGAIKYFVIEVA